jgi:hypothetical protein
VPDYADIIIDEEAPSVTIFNHPKNTSKEFRFNRVFGDGTPQAEFSRTLVDEVVGVSRQNGTSFPIQARAASF